MSKFIPSKSSAIQMALVAAVVLIAYNKVPAFARLVGNPSKG